MFYFNTNICENLEPKLKLPQHKPHNTALPTLGQHASNQNWLAAVKPSMSLPDCGGPRKFHFSLHKHDKQGLFVTFVAQNPGEMLTNIFVSFQTVSLRARGRRRKEKSTYGWERSSNMPPTDEAVGDVPLRTLPILCLLPCGFDDCFQMVESIHSFYP